MKTDGCVLLAFHHFTCYNITFYLLKCGVSTVPAEAAKHISALWLFGLACTTEIDFFFP